MFKSIFLKYIITFMLIIAFSFVVLTLIMASYVNKYAAADKISSLEHIANSVAIYMRKDYEHNNGRLICEQEAFGTMADMLDYDNEETSIFAVSENGDICAVGGEEARSPGAFLNDYTLPRDVIKIVRSGMNYTEKGKLGGMLVKYSYVAVIPVLTTDGVYIGASFVGTSNTAVNGIMSSMAMTIVMSSIWIMLVALVIVYIISERLTTPLRNMSEASKEYAKGNFDRKIEVKGSDEVAQLARSFNDMSNSLKNLEYMRSSFVSNVSHELRTPMTTIGGFVDSILEGCIPPEDEKHYLEIVSAEIKRLSRLVSSLLEISTFESGQKPIDFTNFDICEMARIILISNEQRLDEKHLKVSFECDRDNIEVRADKDSIYRVLFNICDNAVKFSCDGGEYRVKIRDVGEKAEISVYNEGVGIPKEDLPFVFDRFFKSDKSRGLDKNGVGLGMFIVKSVISAHGEDIWVDSEEGKYCRFTFTLKKAKAQPARLKAAQK